MRRVLSQSWQCSVSAMHAKFDTIIMKQSLEDLLVYTRLARSTDLLTITINMSIISLVKQLRAANYGLCIVIFGFLPNNFIHCSSNMHFRY